MKPINLLPQKERTLLIQEEHWKLTLLLEIIFLIFLISLSLILFSIRTYVSGQAEAQKILLSQRELETPQLKDLEDKIKRSNLIFSNLNSFYQKTTNPSEILEQVSEILPSGIYINSFDFVPIGREYLAEVAFFGFSPNRATLLEFKKNLESQETFKEVSFPPSNWITPENINFSVNFKIVK